MTSKPEQEGGSLFIDSILSQDEVNDVHRMLVMEDELNEDAEGYHPISSTQFKHCNKRPDLSLMMSPILDPSFQNPSCSRGAETPRISSLFGPNHS